MVKYIKVVLFLILLLASLKFFSSNLDRFFYFWLLVSIYLSFYNNILNRFSYLMALLLIIETSFSFFLDPMQYRLLYYIYKPAVWAYYFLTVGIISDLLRYFVKK